MKRTNLIKMVLDIVMGIVFALLFNKMVIAGLAFHEIAGLAIGVAFIIHKVLNWKWIKRVTLNIFGKGINIKTRIRYIVAVLLLIAMGYIIVSGVLISKVVFPNLRYGNMFFLKNTHISVSFITLVLLGVHVGLRWDWVMSTFEGVLAIPKGKVWSYVSKVAVVLVFVFGIYNIYSTDFVTRVAMIGTSFSQKTENIQADNGAQGTDTNFTKTLPDGKIPSDRPGKGPRGGEEREGSENANALNTLASYLGIIGVFTIITYYIGKFIPRKRLKAKAT